MEIVGSVATSAVMAAIAIFLVQAVKGLIRNEEDHRYIPLPLAAVLIGVGVLLAWLRGLDMVSGGIEGFMAAAFAVYGWEFFEMFRARG
jgi:hypothetical protein